MKPLTLKEASFIVIYMTENSIITNIYQQFVDYFGESNTDLQRLSPSISQNYNLPNSDFAILVHWSRVTITNEKDNSTTIQDLYSVTPLNSEGKLLKSPTFTRSTYSFKQWRSGYLHSHTPAINTERPENFYNFCLGTSSFKDTVRRLCYMQETDLDIWKLYCWELDKIVHVESLAGRPYLYLSNIGLTRGSKLDNYFYVRSFVVERFERYKSLIKDFIRKILSDNILNYTYVNGRYIIGMPFKTLVLLLSNTFMKWYNTNIAIRETWPLEKLLTKTSPFLISLYFDGADFYYEDNYNIIDKEAVTARNGTHLFTFKDKPVKLFIDVEENTQDEVPVQIIQIDIISFIVYTILKHVNLKYGKSTEDILAENAEIL